MAQSIPFARSSVYQPSLTVADLLLRSGEQQADAEQRRGAINAALWGNLGNSIAQIPVQIESAKRLETRNAMDRQEMDARATEMKARQEQAAATKANAAALSSALPKGRVAALESLEGNPELYAKAQNHFNAIDDNYKRLMGSVAAGVREFGDSPEAAMTALDDLVEQGFDANKLVGLRKQIVERPEGISTLVDNLLKQSPDDAHRALVRKAVEPPKLMEVDPTKLLVNPQTGAVVRPADKKPVEEKLHPVTVDDGKGNPITKLVTADELRQGIPAYRAPKDAKEPAKFWIFRDGKPLRISESEYRPGDLPSSTREQGRPVTSGDAGKITSLNSSLDDLKRLDDALSGSGATGAVAKVGASLPNFVTEFTGLGTDAKQKQALIDRIKQVIGKSLEEGVLRKEDEIKYEKILPTIGDPPAVVRTKLEGLKAAITQRKDRTLESLKDAGYDTSKFESVEEWTRDDKGNLVRKR